MKRYGILAIGSALVLGVSAVAGAQETATHPSFGVVGALNLATFNGPRSQNLQNRVGYAVGGFVSIPLSSAWSFRPELEYTVKGMKVESVPYTFTVHTPSGTQTYQGGPYVETTSLPYVEMPLLLNVQRRVASGAGLFAEFGPALALRVGCQDVVTGNGQSFASSCSTPNSSLRKLDAGAVVGGGISLPLNGHAMTLGARYTFGLRTIAPDGTAKNRNLQFLVGWVL